MTVKDWSGNANSIFKQLGASSHSEEEREQNDYYATDPRAVFDLLKHEEFNHLIWEPASGGGHMVEALRSRGFKVRSSDLINRGCQDELLNFLEYDTKIKWPGDIITNPPYKFCTEFILKALDAVKEGAKVAMFLKLQTLEGQDRYNKLFKNAPPAQFMFMCAAYSALKMASLKDQVRFVMLGSSGLRVLKASQ